MIEVRLWRIGLYRENAIAIESEDSSLWRIDQSGFARKERNLHCDVHVAAEIKHTLPPFGYLDSFWITRSQGSRRRDKGLYRENAIAIQNESGDSNGGNV